MSCSFFGEGRRERQRIWVAVPLPSVRVVLPHSVARSRAGGQLACACVATPSRVGYGDPMFRVSGRGQTTWTCYRRCRRHGRPCCYVALDHQVDPLQACALRAVSHSSSCMFQVSSLCCQQPARTRFCFFTNEFYARTSLLLLSQASRLVGNYGRDGDGLAIPSQFCGARVAATWTWEAAASASACASIMTKRTTSIAAKIPSEQ